MVKCNASADTRPTSVIARCGSAGGSADHKHHDRIAKQRGHYMPGLSRDVWLLHRARGAVLQC